MLASLRKRSTKKANHERNETNTAVRGAMTGVILVVSDRTVIKAHGLLRSRRPKAAVAKLVTRDRAMKVMNSNSLSKRDDDPGQSQGVSVVGTEQKVSRRSTR